MLGAVMRVTQSIEREFVRAAIRYDYLFNLNISSFRVSVAPGSPLSG